jgi:hypothetical protein
MTMAGITQEGVARVLDISVDTLGRHYRTELDTSIDKAVAKVAGSLKTRGRWRDQQAITIGGDADNPLRIERVYSWRMRLPADSLSAITVENDE